MLADVDVAYNCEIAHLKLATHFSSNRPISRSGVAIYKDRPGITSQLVDLRKYCEEFHCEFAGILLKELSLVVVAMYRSRMGTFFKVICIA